jgi:hypothetical protein
VFRIQISSESGQAKFAPLPQKKEKKNKNRL